MEGGDSRIGAEAGRAGAAGAIARNAGFLLLGQIATTALSLVLSAALGRRLGASEFGLLYLLTAMTAFALVVVEWGQGAWLVREVARTRGRAGELLGTALVLRVAGAAVAAVLTVVAAWALGYDARTRALAPLAVAAALPLFLSQTYGVVFRGIERMDQDAAVNVVGRAFTVGVTLPVLAAGGGVVAVLLAQGGAGVAALGVAALLHARLGLPRAAPSRGAARALLAGGAALLAVSLVVAVQPYVDAVILTKLAAPASVGAYAAAKNVMGTVLAPASILATAAYPRLARATNPAALGAEMAAALRPLLIVGALGAAGTWLFADFAIAVLYGTQPEYAPAAAVLRVFSPALLLFYVDWLLAVAIIAVGRSGWFAAVKLGAVVVMAGLEIVLVPFFEARLGSGGVGVVAAFGATEVVILVAAVAIIPRGTLHRAAGFDLLRAGVAAAATIAIVRALPVGPFVGIPLCCAVFAALAAVVGLVRRADLAPLESWIARRRPGVEVPRA